MTDRFTGEPAINIHISRMQPGDRTSATLDKKVSINSAIYSMLLCDVSFGGYCVRSIPGYVVSEVVMSSGVWGTVDTSTYSGSSSDMEDLHFIAQFVTTTPHNVRMLGHTGFNRSIEDARLEAVEQQFKLGKAKSIAMLLCKEELSSKQKEKLADLELIDLLDAVFGMNAGLSWDEVEFLMKPGHEAYGTNKWGLSNAARA